eukprot:m.281837 g.281837  ORF g.281837 m.281837 type:complete len:108 (+) comp22894_c13_seq16:859-1182(+)
MEKEEDVLDSTNQLLLRNNLAKIAYCRTVCAVLAGCTAGILGLTSLAGFAFYLVASLLLSGILLWKVGLSVQNFFLSTRSVYVDGILGGLFTYVLFWTLLYGMVHVF